MHNKSSIHKRVEILYGYLYLGFSVKILDKVYYLFEIPMIQWNRNH